MELLDKQRRAKRNRQQSITHEREIARYFHGERVPMSGAGKIKGDVLIPYDAYRTIYVECKSTKKPSYRVTAALLEKIDHEARVGRCIFGLLTVKFLYRGSIVLIQEKDASQWFQYVLSSEGCLSCTTVAYSEDTRPMLLHGRVMYCFALKHFKELYERTVEGTSDEQTL